MMAHSKQIEGSIDAVVQIGVCGGRGKLRVWWEGETTEGVVGGGN